MARRPKKAPKALFYGVRPAPRISRYTTYVEGLNSTSWANSERWASVISTNVAAIHFFKRLGYYKPPVPRFRQFQQQKIEDDNRPSHTTLRGEGQLFVLFNSGIIYRYDNVPQSVAENLYNCNSPGSFIHQILKNRYITSVVK